MCRSTCICVDVCLCVNSTWQMYLLSFEILQGFFQNGNFKRKQRTHPRIDGWSWLCHLKNLSIGCYNDDDEYNRRMHETVHGNAWLTLIRWQNSKWQKVHCDWLAGMLAMRNGACNHICIHDRVLLAKFPIGQIITHRIPHAVHHTHRKWMPFLDYPFERFAEHAFSIFQAACIAVSLTRQSFFVRFFSVSIVVEIRCAFCDKSDTKLFNWKQHCVLLPYRKWFEVKVFRALCFKTERTKSFENSSTLECNLS